MSGFGATMRLVTGEGGEAVAPGRVTYRHHLTERAEVETEVLSGGHVLHLAVAACLFNDLLRAAGAAGITLTSLEVSADGGFAGDPLAATGIRYDVAITGDAPPEAISELVASVEAAAIIPRTLRDGVEVERGEVTVTASS